MKAVRDETADLRDEVLERSKALWEEAKGAGGVAIGAAVGAAEKSGEALVHASKKLRDASEDALRKIDETTTGIADSIVTTTEFMKGGASKAWTRFVDWNNDNIVSATELADATISSIQSQAHKFADGSKKLTEKLVVEASEQSLAILKAAKDAGDVTIGLTAMGGEKGGKVLRAASEKALRAIDVSKDGIVTTAEFISGGASKAWANFASVLCAACDWTDVSS